MKTLLRIIAWVGFAVFSLGTVISLITTMGILLGHNVGVDFPHLYALILAVIGIPFMLAGGIIAKPRHFWLLSLIIGLLYILGGIPFIQELVSSIQHTDWDYLMQNLCILIPGVIIIAGGIFIRRIETKDKAKAS